MKKIMLTLVACLSVLPSDTLFGANDQRRGNSRNNRRASADVQSVAAASTSASSSSAAAAVSSCSSASSSSSTATTHVTPPATPTVTITASPSLDPSPTPAPTPSAAAAAASMPALIAATSSANGSHSSSQSQKSPKIAPAVVSSLVGWFRLPDSIVGHSTNVVTELEQLRFDKADKIKASHRLDHSAKQLREARDTNGMIALFEHGLEQSVPFAEVAFQHGVGCIDDGLAAEKAAAAKAFSDYYTKIVTLKKGKTLVKKAGHKKFGRMSTEQDSDDEDYTERYVFVKYMQSNLQDAEKIKAAERRKKERELQHAAQQQKALAAKAAASSAAAAAAIATTPSGNPAPAKK